MSGKRLITDSFQVVKKEGGREERKAAQTRSPPQDLVQADSHLQDIAQPDQLEILKQFDLNWQYGPCSGITRMQRWERAKFLGLNPPTTVQDLLLKYNKDPFVIYRSNDLPAESKLFSKFLIQRAQKDHQLCFKAISNLYKAKKRLKIEPSIQVLIGS